MGVLLVALTAGLLTLVHGQVEIRPVQVRGSVGDIVNITCIVGTVSTSSTLLLTAQNVQLTPNFTDVQTDRVVFGYGPLTAEDDNRPVICSFGTMEAEGVISVLFPPTFTPEQPMFDVPEDSQNFVITLGVTGNPLPTDEQTMWLFNSGSLGSGVTGSSTSLSFTSVSRDHAGVYTVRAETEAGPSNTVSITFNVLYPPTFAANLSTGIACQMISTTYMCAVMVGGSGSLNCAAVSFPAPSLNITSSSPRIVGDTSSGSVAVRDVTDDDNGTTVTCIATNSQGMAQRSFSISVGMSPAQPTSVVANVEGGVVTVTWQYSDPGNNVPLRQFLYRVSTVTGTEVLSNMTTERTFSVPLSMLDGSTLYNVELRADNLLGSSDPAGTRFATPMKDSDGSSLMLMAPCVSVLLMIAVTTIISV